MAGMFALTAMTSGQTQTILASMCPPAAEMRGSDAARTGECPLAGSHGRDMDDHGDQGQRHCPFTSAAAAQFCTGLVCGPAPALDTFSGSPDRVLAVSLDKAEQNLLLVNALFRPPRA